MVDENFLFNQKVSKPQGSTLSIMINKINITDKLYSIYLNKVELFELTIGSTLVELSIYKHMVLIKKCYMHNILKNHNYRAITG